MADVSASIRYEEYDGTEEPFVPVESMKKIEIVLEPEKETPYLYSPETSWQPYRPEVPKERACVIDIETTGIDPTKSRLVCIGAKDPQFIDQEPVIFFNQDLDYEEEAVLAFKNWFTENGFTKIIGYNADFDYRFILTLLMKYRIVWPEWFKVDIFDLMDYLKKGKTKYVPTMNRVNKLQEWAEFFLGKVKLMSFPELMRAIEEKDWAKIIEYNKVDVELCFLIWYLVIYCSEDSIE